MATFVVAHGAWSGGWSWKKLRPLLRAAGHELFTPTYTGLGERLHLATPEVGLETHIQDVLNVLELEDLRDVVLVGHSYGGMVATGVADRAADRIRLLVYLDAFVPRDGQSLTDLLRERQGAGPPAPGSGGVEDWRVPPMEPSADTRPEDLAWVTPRRMPQPRKTFEEPIRLTGAVDRLPRVYIYCTQFRPGDGFRPFAERAKREPGWRYEEIDATHSPNITAPELLAALLDRLARTS